MDQWICNWTPQLIVEVIKAVVWPITLLLVIVIGLNFRSGIYKFIENLFSKSTISEVSATSTGISAKFVTERQASEARELPTISAVVSLPESLNIDAIRKRIEQNKTEFSEEYYKAVKLHLDALKLNHDEQIEILAKEISLFQSYFRYNDINKVIFRSQLNLLLAISLKDSGYIAKDEVERYFSAVKESYKEAYANWDWIRYISYPVTTGLISDEGSGYKLTTLGNSYTIFMKRNTNLVDEISKL